MGWPEPNIKMADGSGWADRNLILKLPADPDIKMADGSRWADRNPILKLPVDPDRLTRT